MSIFDSQTIARRQQLAADNFNATIDNQDLVLVFSGTPLQKPGGFDQTYDFLPHPDYYWLTGSRRPNEVMAFSKDSGWTRFHNPQTADELLWEGPEEVDTSGQPISEFESWLDSRQNMNWVALGQPGCLWHDKINQDQSSYVRIKESLNASRRPKDASEIHLIRKCAEAAHRGFKKIKETVRPGMTERELQLIYESEVLRAGADKFPYSTLIGSGSNSAVLHAIPSNKVIGQDDMILVDAGADMSDYCVDITRMFHSTHSFNSQQKDLYQLVEQAQTEAIDKCQSGVEWLEIHKTAAQVIARGLKELNIFTCSVEEALESGAIATFFPHGVGHMVGLRVRDVGAIFGKEPKTVCGARIRVDFPLQKDFVMTVEPGCYFIPNLLDHPRTREKFGAMIHWDEVDKWRHIGGVRLEDDLRITEAQPEILTR